MSFSRIWFFVLMTIFFSPSSPNLTCENTNFDFIVPDNFTVTTNQNQITMNPYNNLAFASNAYLTKKIGTNFSWIISFRVQLSSCYVEDGCFGDGFSFIIRNSTLNPNTLGTSGGSLGYCNYTTETSSFAVLFQYYKSCSQFRPFIRLVNGSSSCYQKFQYSLVTSVDPTGKWNGSYVTKQENRSIDTAINFNGSHLSVFFDNLTTSWFDYEINLSNYYPFVIVGFGFGTSSTTCIFNFSNISLKLCNITETSNTEISNITENSVRENNITFICKNGNCFSNQLILKKKETISFPVFISGGVTVGNSVTFTVAGSIFSVSNSVNLEENSILVIENNPSFSIGGNFILKQNSTLLLKLDPTSKFSTLKIKGCINITGSNLKIILNWNKWKFLQIPNIPSEFVLFNNSCLIGKFSESNSTDPILCTNFKNYYFEDRMTISFFGDRCQKDIFQKKIIFGIVFIFFLGISFMFGTIVVCSKKLRKIVFPFSNEIP